MKLPQITKLSTERINMSNKTNNWVSVPLWDYWDTANANTAEAALYRDVDENVGYLHYNEDFVDSIAATLQCLTDAKTNYGNSFAPLGMEFEVKDGWWFEYPDNRESKYCYFKFRVLPGGDIWLVFFGSGKNGSVEYSVALPDLPTLRETLKNGHE